MEALKSLQPGVWLASVSLGDYDVRGALLVGDTRAVVWDTLSHPRDMAPYLPLIGDRDLVIVYSHADWDHVWGTAGLPHERALIVGHDACRNRFSADVPITLAEKRFAEPDAWAGVLPVPPAQCFASECSLDAGGLTLSLHHLPGHTADCIVGFVPERGVLLAGDTVETPCPVVPPDSTLPAWIAGLCRWEGDPRLHTVVPAHGAIGGREILQQNIAYLRGIVDGHPITPAGHLTDFYRDTHRKNTAWRGPRARW
jgi:glyoxylase-like metal-dependent hydrolase (beta-lactamase superfamily II)